MSLNDLEFRILKEEETDIVTQFTMDHFMAVEPVTNTISLSLDERRMFIQPRIKNALWQNASIGVYDSTNEMCAVCLNFLGKNEHTLPPFDYNVEEQSLRLRQLEKVVLDLFSEELSSTVGAKNYLKNFLVAVERDYGNRGIATELLRRCEDIAKKNGCTIIPVLCTNAYTLRATMKLGYEVLKQIPCADYVDPITGEKILKYMKKPHIALTLVAKNV